MKKLVLGLVGVLVLGSLTVFAQKADRGNKKATAKNENASFVKASYQSTMDTKDIIKTAEAAGNFKTLLAAVKAADLIYTWQGPGPFTLFAPTDEAFAKLPAGTLENLLKPENKAALIRILKYHIVLDKFTAAKIKKLKSVNTTQGQAVKVTAKKGKVMINNSNVIKADMMSDNGVIHVIDTVLMPK